jgi:hypothetical protein
VQREQYRLEAIICGISPAPSPDPFVRIENLWTPTKSILSDAAPWAASLYQALAVPYEAMLSRLDKEHRFEAQRAIRMCWGIAQARDPWNLSLPRRELDTLIRDSASATDIADAARRVLELDDFSRLDQTRRLSPEERKRIEGLAAGR